MTKGANAFFQILPKSCVLTALQAKKYLDNL